MIKVQLFISGERVDLFKDDKLSITSKIQDVRDIEKVFTEFTKSFSIPASSNNNKIFKHYYNFNIVGGFDARKKTTASIQLNTTPFKKGSVRLDSVKLKNGKPHSYKITFFGGTADLTDILGEDNLSSLAWLNNFNQTYDATTVRTLLGNGADVTVDSVTYTDAVLTPLITNTTRLYYDEADANTPDYSDGKKLDPLGGNLYPQGSGAGHHHGVYYEELKYAIRLHLIVLAIQEQYSEIVFSNDFFNTTNDAYHSLYMWLHRSKGYTFDSTEVIEQLINLPFDSTTLSNVTLQNNDIIVYGLIGSQQVSMGIEISRSATNFPYSIVVKSGGSVYAEVVIPSGSLGTFTVALDNNLSGYTIFIKTKTAITIQGDGSSQTQLNFITPTQSASFYTSADQTINLTQQFTMTEQLPDIQIIDFLTSLFKMFNLTAFQQDDGTVKVQTLDSFYAENTIEHNLTSFIDSSESTVGIALPFKEIDFGFEGLGTKLAEDHKQRFNVEWGTTEYKGNDNFDFSTKKYEVRPQFEHMKFERLFESDDATLTDIQYGWFVDDNDDPYYGEPLLFYPIQISSSQSIRFLNTAVHGNSGSQSDVSIYYIPSNSLAKTSISSDVNINFNKENNEYAAADPSLSNDFIGTLFFNYYSTYISSVFLQSNRITSVKVNLPFNFIINHTLADVIVYKDNKYLINSLNFDMTTGKGKMELINNYDLANKVSISPANDSDSTAVDACANQTPSVLVYYNIKLTLANSVSLFTDEALTIPFAGDGDFYKLSTNQSARVNSVGLISSLTNC